MSGIKTEEASAKPPFPLAVFLFGTGETSKKTQSFISSFYEHCNSHKLLVEGPTLTGKEVAQYVQETTDYIIETLNKTALNDLPNPIPISLTGFSRGAVECLRVANALDQHATRLREKQRKQGGLNEQESRRLDKLDRLALNIFAVDPVAGANEMATFEARHIPQNVTNYTAILQTDEMRQDFAPQDMTRIIIEKPEKTHVSLLPLYGHHSGAIKMRPETQSAAKILHSALYNNFTSHGITFAGNQAPPVLMENQPEVSGAAPQTLKDVLAEFTSHHNERDAHAKKGRRSKLLDSSWFRSERRFNQYRGFYVEDSAFFINQLERDVFKLTHPKIFNYLFEGNVADPRFPSDSASLQSEVEKALTTLKSEDPALFNRLVQAELGVSESNDEINLEGPRGIPNLESLDTAIQTYPDLVPEAVKNAHLDEAVADVRALRALESRIFHMTFQYELEKPAYLFFTDRMQAEWSQDVRQQAYDIVRQQDTSPKEKHTALVNMLEKETARMRHAFVGEPFVQLTNKLEGLVKQNGGTVTPPQTPSFTTSAVRGATGAAIYALQGLAIFPGYILSTVGQGFLDMGNRLPFVGGAFVGLGKLLKAPTQGMNALARVLSRARDAFSIAHAAPAEVAPAASTQTPPEATAPEEKEEIEEIQSKTTEVPSPPKDLPKGLDIRVEETSAPPSPKTVAASLTPPAEPASKRKTFNQSELKAAINTLRDEKTFKKPDDLEPPSNTPQAGS